MPTTEELRIKLEEEEKRKKEHDKWRKEKNWFVSVPREPFYDGELGDIICTFEEIKESLEEYEKNYGMTNWKGKIQFLYRTNAWKEDLEEIG